MCVCVRARASVCVCACVGVCMYVCIYLGVFICLFIYINLNSWEHAVTYLDNGGRSLILTCPVAWGCRIHRLLLCRGVRLSPPNKCPVYYTKQYDGEVPVMLVLRGMRSTSSLPSLPGPLWPGVVAPDKVLSMGQTELNCVLRLN